MAKFSAGDADSIDVARVRNGQGVIVTLRPRSGVFSSDDPEDIETFRSFGLTERSDAQVKASKARRAPKARRGNSSTALAAKSEPEAPATDTEVGS